MAKKKSNLTKEAAKQIEYDLFGDPIIPEEEQQTVDDFSIKDKTSPFDIIDKMFKDQAGFFALSKACLTRNAFMVTRTFAIKYPIQAAYLNYCSINQAEVLHYINAYLMSKEPRWRVPSWCYTKGSKKSSEAKDKQQTVTKQQKEQYALYYKYSMKDVEDALKFNPIEMAEDIIRLDKLLNPPKDIIEKEEIKTKNI